MKHIAAVSLVLVFCGLVIADQDDIDLDPGGGSWAVIGGSSLPGARGEIRDDLLDMPEGMERAICYNHPDAGLKAASKLRFAIRTGPGAFETVVITDKSGNKSGVRVSWHDYRIVKTCDHTVVDDCTNSGIPSELWGEFVDGKVEVKDKDSGIWVQIESHVRLQKVATGGACNAFP
jgi:hypothetical protein